MKMLLSLILALTMVVCGIASASAASLSFYDATTNKLYDDDSSDAQLEELIQAYLDGNELWKMAGDKLVDYNAYRDKIIDVITEALNNNEDVNTAVLGKLQEILDDLDEKEIPPEGDLKVLEISAITNKTEVLVLLDNVPEVLPAPGTFTVEDSNGNIYAVTSIALVDGNEYKLTLGTAIAGKGTLTVKYGETSATYDFDYTLEGLTLDMEFSDEDAVLTSDGADNTIVTVTVLQNGETNKDFDGTVKFMSLKGATFAKETVAFDKGVAKVQLTSMSSALPIVDTIIATIADADDLEAVGKSVQRNISYVPEAISGEVSEKVFITYAESDKASEVFVKFNEKYDFDKVYAERSKITVESPIGTSKTVTDIVKIDETTIKLILLEANALTDNSTVEVKITGAGQFDSGLIDSSIKFNLVDPKAPEALSVTAPDYRTIVTRFTEPVTNDSAKTPGNWVLNGKQLLAADLDGGVAQVGKLLDGAHTVYKADKNNPVDNRAYVTLNLTAAGVAKLKDVKEENLLQAYNIEDYAGLTDKTGQNTATTQEFRFITPEMPGAPKAIITMESPEQYRVEFDQALQNQLDKDNFAVRYQAGEASNGTPLFIGDTGAPAVTPVSNPVMADSFTGNANEVIVTLVGGANDEYLLEFAQDWTETLDTDGTKVNYYTPGRNNIEITVVAQPGGGANDVESLAGVKMSANYSNVMKLVRDNKGPKIADAYQNKDASGEFLQTFTVVMNEPIQMNTGDASVDTKELTPSQTQSDGDGVPTPTFQFISEDESITVDGQLESSISDDDMTFVIEPKRALTVGIWTISIKSISDDVGNTADTVEYTLEVKGVAAAAGKAEIIWADAHDNADYYGDGVFYDVVHIQYGTEMSLDALQSNIYTINGKILPVGTMIVSDEEVYDTVNNLEGTRVTIVLPKEFLGSIDNIEINDATDYDNDYDEPHMLNVSKQLTDAKGNKIISPTEVELKYEKAGYSVVH